MTASGPSSLSLAILAGLAVVAGCHLLVLSEIAGLLVSWPAAK